MKEKGSIQVSFGIFHYQEDFQSYELDDGKIYWALQPSNEDDHEVRDLIQKAEQLHKDLAAFEPKAKAAIAEELIDYKNDVWLEYDEDDEDLDWDAVDAGEYAVSKEAFAAFMSLLHIDIRTDEIYLEYDDGEMFGGHRIHAHFDFDYNFIKADV